MMEYDQHPTNPIHGGRMTMEQFIERMEELEQFVEWCITTMEAQDPDDLAECRSINHQTYYKACQLTRRER